MKSKEAMPIIILLILLTQISAAHSLEISEMTVKIYASLSCSSCKRYVDTVIPVLNEVGITDITVRDRSTDRTAITELAELYAEIGVPTSMRGNVVVVVDGRYFFEDYVPAKNITGFLKDEASYYEHFVLYMPPRRDTYQIMNDLGEVIECKITEPIKSCDAEKFKRVIPSETLLPLVIGAGLLNGFNPCSLTVLLFITAILFSLGNNRKRVILAGIVYLTAIFLIYLSVGFGVLHTITILPSSDLLTGIGAIILIALGLVNIKDYFWYGRGFSLQMPQSQLSRIADWTRKATLPTSAALGLLVGLLTFPCMGGIYLTIIGMITLSPMYLEAIVYLLIYNLITLLPSITLLYLASNRTVVKRLYDWTESKKRWMRLAAGLGMLAFGVLILIM
jgi:cytochrome c biogenesis protein CcdA